MLADDVRADSLPVGWLMIEMLEPVAESRDLFGPFVFGGKVGLCDGVMFAFEDGEDGGAEGGGHVVFASGHDGSPWGVEENVADAGLAMQEDRDAALKRFDCGNAVALNSGHEEEMRRCVELLEILVGDEAVEVDAIADAQILRHPL